MPVDGNYTLDLDGMVEVLHALKAPLMIPMHYFSAYTLNRFLDRVRAGMGGGNRRGALDAGVQGEPAGQAEGLVLPGHSSELTQKHLYVYVGQAGFARAQELSTADHAGIDPHGTKRLLSRTRRDCSNASKEAQFPMMQTSERLETASRCQQRRYNRGPDRPRRLRGAPHHVRPGHGLRTCPRGGQYHRRA